MKTLMMQRRKLLTSALYGAVAAYGLRPAMAFAAQWPAKAVNFIVPFAPGGPVDTAARIVTNGMSQQWQQTAVIENRAGAGGILGARLSAQAKPDGYNYFFAAIHHAILPSLNQSLEYDIQKDFVPVGMVARFPIILVAHPSLKVKSVKELIALAKAQPGKIAYSSSGTGGGTHLAGALFASMARIELQHVPYKGSAPAVQDLVGGQVQLMFADATSALPFIKSGKVIPLGVGNPQRSELAPDVPPIADEGLPGYEAYSWSGLFAPVGTPADVVKQFNQDLNVQLKDKDVIAKMHGSGSEAMPMTPDAFGTFLSDEIAKWHKTITEANITIQG
ncbi:putative Bug-like extracytoplasmic solute binding receptor, TTT family [Advenella mimigardefordensis DPN7]|uniref:Putative Bug-like extracytoplasmic solute binding receptor, TTT family n=2 Tax=Advenella mimigardefordensis TaxID=302406 RepID=W0P9E8_ADVMD|nr:tripartite tricarboxylate transporter substrate binding protein [Advenella mimigardefordensis]AHG63341.1 putative Bug-like extracytoplasmic solute binding receptor, TTT family [Advenella mimigardefordensis DPN7]